MELRVLAALREAWQRCDDLHIDTVGLDLDIVQERSSLQAAIERNFDRISASLSEARDAESSLSQSISHLDDVICFGEWVADGRLIDERSTWAVRMSDLPKLQHEIRSLIERHGGDLH